MIGAGIVLSFLLLCEGRQQKKKKEKSHGLARAALPRETGRRLALIQSGLAAESFESTPKAVRNLLRVLGGRKGKGKDRDGHQKGERGKKREVVRRWEFTIRIPKPSLVLALGKERLRASLSSKGEKRRKHLHW